MGDAAYFRREAEHYRGLAAKEQNLAVAERMRDFAKHYEALASLMEEASSRPAGAIREQPMQQQQGKLGADDTFEC